MKSFILSIIAFLLVLCTTAQITFTSADLMDVGDSVLLANADTVPVGFNPGPPGANLHWDFSAIQMDTTTALRFIDPANTPYGASFPLSNVAVEGMVGELGVEGWLFGMKNTSLYQIDGAAGSYDIFEDIVVPFNPPEIMFEFPVNYLDSMEQTTVIDLSLESPEPPADSIRIKVVTTVESKVDAWGELITPVWTGNVLRTRDVRVTIDSSWAKIVFFWVFLETNTNVSVTYKYLANDVGYPVMQFNANEEGTEFSLINYLLVAGVGETELTSKTEIIMDIYPNPASSLIHCKMQNIEGDGELFVYDLSGRKKTSILISPNQQFQTIDVSAYPAGVYNLVLQSDNGSVLSRKFVVR